NLGALTTAALLTAALVLTIIVLAISNVFITRERDEKDQALKEKGAAFAQANETADLLRRQDYLHSVALAQREWLHPKSAKVTTGSSARTAAKCALPSIPATTSPTASAAKQTSTTSTCSSPWAMTSAPPSPSSNVGSINTRPGKPKRKR